MKYEYRKIERALVLEDDIWMKPLIITALKSVISDIRVDWVDSVEDAMRKIRFRQYSVVVVDIHLKQNTESGLEFWNFCQREFSEVPIILTSSIPIDDFSKKMGWYGTHYLFKPFTISQCSDAIRNIVSFIGPAS